MSNIHKNFNSRTREGATKKQLGGRIGLLVSIHAPVWVRLYDVYIVIGLLEFQFTHPCGCDGKCPASSYYLFSFNSRTRVGATHAIPFPWVGLCVSIHAPVWVRHNRPSIWNPLMLFQFTHPCGCDCMVAVGQLAGPMFQFTHPCGCDQQCFENCYNPAPFQFTHPCGCDPGALSRRFRLPGFNSRTRVGATPNFFIRASSDRFQFTHPCGCD